MIDVPLVVGKSTSSASQALSWEDMMQQCISKGWEYVDLSDNGDDELGGEHYGSIRTQCANLKSH